MNRVLTARVAWRALLALQPLSRAEAQAGAPRIGLALSGGGARGLAHIGVLKVLEELRVPVHCVTGTSMGAVVGGAYASGTTPAALEKFVRDTDWEKVFSDRPPRAEVAIQRKMDDYKTLFAPEYGVKSTGLALPKGVVAGVSIEGFLRSLVSPTVSVTDFSKLPIPYRAVAADIETGEAVVLDRGSLPQAMRASMSVPGALAPVEIDGRLLVDGGIADNLPINVARKVCADVVIAVNISTPALKRSEITSALSVAGQLINFLGKVNVDEQLKSLGSRDVLIAPELGDISAGSFERAADAIRIGEEAARAMAAQLQRYSLPPEQYAALRRKQVRERKDLGMVDEIRFEGLKRTSPEVLRFAGAQQAGRAAHGGDPQRGPAAHLRPRRLRGHRLPHRGRARRARRWSSARARRSGDRTTCASGIGLASDFAGRQHLQRPGAVPQHLAQPAGRRMALRSAVRPDVVPGHGIHAAGARARRLLRRAVRQGRRDAPQPVHRRGPRRGVHRQGLAPRPGRRRQPRHLGRAAARRALATRERGGGNGLGPPVPTSTSARQACARG